MFTRRTAHPPLHRDPGSAGDVGAQLDKALDGDLEHVQRVRALWSLAHLPAFLDVGRTQHRAHRTLANALASLLDHPSTLIARETFEVLTTLRTFGDGVDALGELGLAAGTRGGRVVISPHCFSTLERCSVRPRRAWCPDVDVEVRALAGVAGLLDAAAGPGFLVNTSAGGTDLVVAHANGALWRVQERRRIMRVLARHAPLVDDGGDGAGAGAGAVGENQAALRRVPVVERAADGSGGWRIESQLSASALVVDGEPAQTGAAVPLLPHGHHVVQWDDSDVHVVVVPAVRVGRRVIIEAPEGVGFDAVGEGDAWFSPLKLARGHVTLRGDTVIVVDTTGSEPHVIALRAGEGAAWGAYTVDFEGDGEAQRIRIAGAGADGPVRNRQAKAQRASVAAKKAA